MTSPAASATALNIDNVTTTYADAPILFAKNPKALE